MGEKMFGMKKIFGSMEDAEDSREFSMFSEDDNEPITHKDSKCETCLESLGEGMDHYAWLIRDVKGFSDCVEEIFFCSKRCWKDFLEEELGRLNKNEKRSKN